MTASTTGVGHPAHCCRPSPAPCSEGPSPPQDAPLSQSWFEQGHPQPNGLCLLSPQEANKHIEWQKRNNFHTHSKLTHPLHTHHKHPHLSIPHTLHTHTPLHTWFIASTTGTSSVIKLPSSSSSPLSVSRMTRATAPPPEDTPPPTPALGSWDIWCRSTRGGAGRELPGRLIWELNTTTHTNYSTLTHTLISTTL